MSKKRKTREEKIRASLRRMTSQQFGQFATPSFSFVKREFGEAQPSPEIQTQEEKEQVNTAQIEFLASIKRDLLKTFVLASLIFIAEAVLYFLLREG